MRGVIFLALVAFWAAMILWPWVMTGLFALLCLWALANYFYRSLRDV